MVSQLPGSGWTLVSDNPHTTVAPAGWSTFTGGGEPNSGQTPPRIVSDPTAPDGDGSAVEYSYAGVGDGYEPQKSYVGFTSSSELYWATYVQWAPTWTWPASSGFKQFIFGEGGPLGWFGTGRYQAAPFNGSNASVGRAAWDSNGFDEAPLLVTEPPLRTGQWYKLVLYLKVSPPQRVAAWINSGAGDVLIQDSAVNPGGTFNLGPTFINELQFPATRGGGTPGPGLPGDTMRFARTVVYRR